MNNGNISYYKAVQKYINEQAEESRGTVLWRTSKRACDIAL